MSEWLTKIGWWLIKRAEPKAANDYRVIRVRGGFEPQMSYSTGCTDALFWVPLTSQGYWSDPSSFAFGFVSKRPAPMPKELALQAIERARSINRTGSVLSAAEEPK